MGRTASQPRPRAGYQARLGKERDHNKRGRPSPRFQNCQCKLPVGGHKKCVHDFFGFRYELLCVRLKSSARKHTCRLLLSRPASPCSAALVVDRRCITPSLLRISRSGLADQALYTRIVLYSICQYDKSDNTDMRPLCRVVAMQRGRLVRQLL